MKEEIKYPADRVVHWATGPVNTCETHGTQLVVLGNFLGSHIAVTKLETPSERELEKLLREVNLWPTDEAAIIRSLTETV